MPPEVATRCPLSDESRHFPFAPSGGNQWLASNGKVRSVLPLNDVTEKWKLCLRNSIHCHSRLDLDPQVDRANDRLQREGTRCLDTHVGHTPHSEGQVDPTV